MEIISEEKKVDHSEKLPQIVQRIFSVCKEDPSFPLRDQIKIVEGEILGLKKKLAGQALLLKKSRETRNKLTRRASKLIESNVDLREELLSELGSQ